MQPEILADENVDYRIVKNLRNEGFKVISILEDYRGLSDKKILELSRNQRALLLTEDKDFGEWIFAHKEQSIGVIFLRYKSDEVKEISKSLINILLKYTDSLYHKFAVVRVNKIRIREFP